ncbi:hypothetical protein SERLADRAFT_404498 [Serpula lacrymans var. lacrymans S7.9]|uniref:Uncharacterized protein n=1 Tax=Serpula lacrymans var. lacrymans (strain S7.9) TaxID=578457 RepID=F8NDJ4_SERL9|nr:uncharacterized protein SERLADRAFT_404498 [Serpula lacrymans var. lacrymans S7.9]EGO30227.1 hypothetical protein SERLADRAFT_404498 [Serpula lacrymans var. lacrymans S7.9]
MYWPIGPVQHRDQFVERLREEVVSGTDAISEGNKAHLLTLHCLTPQSDGQDLIDFSFTSLVPSHVQWLSPAQQWSLPPSLEKRVARMEQRQGIIGDLYGRISQLEDEVARLTVKEREYN